MGALQTFEASLRHAVRERQAATVGGGHFTHQELEEVLSEIEALRNAKAQLEAMVGAQEPVAWMGIPVMPGRYKEAVFCSDKDLASQWDYSGHTGLGRLIVTPLYATPVAQQPQAECRSDGRCQYAIDYGAEGLGHCPEGKCAMKQPQAEVAEVFYCKTCGTAMQMPHDDCLACERGERQQPQAEAVLRKLEWAEVRHEYREAEYFCPICDRDKRQGHEAGCELAAALTPQQAEAVPPGYVLVPVEVLKAASESLGNFVSDHGWTTLDMQAMDNIDAILAQQKGGV